MSVTSDLSAARLEGVDVELGCSLAASLYGTEDPRSECFGLTPEGAPTQGGVPWGVFVKGTLSGVLWLLPPVGGRAEISALAIPKGWWGAGLLLFLAAEAGRAAALSGCDALAVRLTGGTPALAEALEEAGFTGPDDEDDAYPAGEWLRPSAPQRAETN